MKKGFVPLILTLGLLVPAFAGAQSGTITGDYVGCVTSGALTEFVQASNAQDHRQMQALLDGQCFYLRGRTYSSVDRGFMTSTIRVYTSSGSLVLHVPSEAVR